MLSEDTASQNLQIQIWPIDRLVFYARNPRKNDAAVDRMCSSIREFGFKIPVLARSDGEVVDGHLRLKAARKLGLWPSGDTTQIPVILCDEWTPAQVKAFRLMVNRSVAWAEWDDELLGLELSDLKDLDFDLDLTGFDRDELGQYLASIEPIDGLTDEDAAPEPPQQAASRTGDLWILGNHRVFCGDATIASEVELLMAGEKSDLVFTDPHYNVDYEGYTKQKLKIQGDCMGDDQFAHFLRNAFSSYSTIIKP